MKQTRKYLVSYILNRSFISSFLLSDDGWLAACHASLDTSLILQKGRTTQSANVETHVNCFFPHVGVEAAVCVTSRWRSCNNLFLTLNFPTALETYRDEHCMVLFITYWFAFANLSYSISLYHRVRKYPTCNTPLLYPGLENCRWSAPVTTRAVS